MMLVGTAIDIVQSLGTVGLNLAASLADSDAPPSWSSLRLYTVISIFNSM